jgi:bifunctional DNA-binding transcriptional regulator/antitoxin component of YhaV-PrlF toxin-antitoxin module
MKKELFEVGSPEIPQVLWTLPVEKVTNEKGKDEYIISLPEKVRKHMKLKQGDKVFFGERANNSFEVRKATQEELIYYKIEKERQKGM